MILVKIKADETVDMDYFKNFRKIQELNFKLIAKQSVIYGRNYPQTRGEVSVVPIMSANAFFNFG